MSVWKKTKFMLGLAADDEYEDGTEQELAPAVRPERRAEPGPAPSASGGPSPSPQRAPRRGPKPARQIKPKPANPPARTQKTRPADAGRAHGGKGGRSVVRPIPAATTTKPHVMAPLSFNDAQEIGDKFKEKTPVLVNLENTDRDTTRRLIDFASGLCYGLGGQMEKVSDHVYMLVPPDVEVSAEERQRLRDQGLHDE